MVLTTKEVLIATLEIIQDPSKRTTGSFARDKNHKVVWPKDVDACRWCTIGALAKCDPESKITDLYATPAYQMLKASLAIVNPEGHNVIRTTDEGRFDIIILAIEHAIENYPLAIAA